MKRFKMSRSVFIDHQSYGYVAFFLEIMNFYSKKNLRYTIVRALIKVKVKLHKNVTLVTARIYHIYNRGFHLGFVGFCVWIKNLILHILV